MILQEISLFGIHSSSVTVGHEEYAPDQWNRSSAAEPFSTRAKEIFAYPTHSRQIVHFEDRHTHHTPEN